MIHISGTTYSSKAAYPGMLSTTLRQAPSPTFPRTPRESACLLTLRLVPGRRIFPYSSMFKFQYSCFGAPKDPNSLALLASRGIYPPPLDLPLRLACHEYHRISYCLRRHRQGFPLLPFRIPRLLPTLFAVKQLLPVPTCSANIFLGRHRSYGMDTLSAEGI